MGSVTKRSGVAAGLVFALLLLAATAASAQLPQQNPYFQHGPGLTPQQYAYNMALYGRAMGQAAPYGFGFGQNPYGGYPAAPVGYGSLTSTPFGGGASMTSSPYGGPGAGSSYNPYSPNYYESEAAGYLRGGAAVIDSQGRFLVSIQQANLIREQVRAERIANRRRAFEEYMYVRERTPTLEQERERRLVQERDRSRNDPPVTEIWSGKALNDILGELRSLRAKGQLAANKAPNLPLDEDLLKHVNVTGKDGGNLGLLRNDGKVTWPAALQGEETKKDRERVSALAQEAVEQAKFKNVVDPGTLKQLQTDVESLHQQLSKNVGELPTAQYIEARRFLNHFDDALKVLGGPSPGNYVTRKWAAKGKTVAELVQNMLDAGLQFAPAVAGDEAAYVALHRALATFDGAMQTQVTADPSK